MVVEPERKASGNSSAWRIFYAAVLCLALALAVVSVAGCGLQTDQANKDLTKANAHQQEAEALIARVKALPDDWQRIFATPSPTPQQIAQVRDVITARVADLDALGKVTKNWSSLTDLEKKAQARYMEIYAAMVDSVDQSVGRVLDTIEALLEARLVQL